MSTRFHWQTGAREAAWEDEAAPVGTSGRTGWRSVWLLGGVVGLIVVGIVLGFARQRVQRAETAVSQQVLTSHRLIRLADARHDTELFRLALSGRDPAWANEMARFGAAGSLFDRPAFGLRALPGEAGLPPQNLNEDDVEVLLSPDLASAEVSWPHPYPAGDETVTLRQTAVYRRGRQGWLLAPPDLDFWGGWDVVPGQHLTLAYPVRDQEIARRLVADLDELLVEVCRKLPGLNCPADLHVRLRLETEPDSQLAADSTIFSICRGLQLGLPAPTLVGLPLDEAGYHALFRGYGAHVVTAVITEQLGYTCCQHGLFFQALLEAQLVQLDLRPWPLTQLQYDQLAQDQVSLHDVGRYWDGTYLVDQVSDAGPVYTLVDFLVRQNREPVLFMLQVLSPAVTLDFWDWLHLATGGEFAAEQSLERAWLQFLGQETAITQPPPFPGQDLQLACQADPGAKAALFRYQPDTGLIEKEMELMQPSVFMVGLPDDKGVVVGERRAPGGAATMRLLLWQGETPTVLLRSTDDVLPVTFPSTQAGDQLLVFIRRSRQYGLLSPGQCQSASRCAVEALHGLPLWSPDGRQAISLVVMGNYGYEDRFARPFVLGSVTGTILGTGKSHFWVDDENVAFIEPFEQVVMTVTTGKNPAPSKLFSVEDLVATLPDQEGTDQMRLEHIAIDPAGPDSFWVVTAVPDHTYFFRYHLPTNEVTFEAMSDVRLAPQVLYDYGFSPDGRWLVISGSNLTVGTSTIHLYDVGQKETHSYEFTAVYDLPLHWRLDWSADGQWLTVPDNGHLRLIAPAHDYQTLVVPEDVLCSGAVWVNKINDQ